MGPAYAESVILNLEATWGESDPRIPLICFLSMGSDPTNQIENLAKKLQLGINLDFLRFIIIAIFCMQMTSESILWTFHCTSVISIISITVNPLYNGISYKSKNHYKVNQIAQKSADRVFFH